METVSLVTVGVISLALTGPEGFGAGAEGSTGWDWGVAVEAITGVDGAGGVAGTWLGPVAVAWPAQAARIETSDNKTIVSAIFLFICCVLLLVFNDVIYNIHPLL